MVMMLIIMIMKQQRFVFGLSYFIDFLVDLIDV
jgi:hypothetical protein